MKIYFSASIKGGRQLVDNYAVMIKHLLQYGEVLTEHIGNNDYGKSGYKDAVTVYTEDTQYLDQCDIVVADITIPSLGVGYELAYAENRNKPVYCLYDNTITNSVSSMVIGNEYFQCYRYNDINSALVIIDNIFTKEAL